MTYRSVLTKIPGLLLFLSIVALILIDDEYVVSGLANRFDFDVSTLRNAGCLPGNPFYLAINPKFQWSRELVALLNVAFGSSENREILTSIIEKSIGPH